MSCIHCPSSPQIVSSSHLLVAKPLSCHWVLTLFVVVPASVCVHWLLFGLVKALSLLRAFETSISSLDSDELDDDELDDEEEPFSSLLGATSGSNRTLFCLPLLIRSLRALLFVRFGFVFTWPCSSTLDTASSQSVGRFEVALHCFSSLAPYDGHCAPTLPRSQQPCNQRNLQ